MSLHSYPSILALGHKGIEELFADEVVVQEKVDGSQFSFGTLNGTLYIRSKGAEIDPLNPPKLFAKAVSTVIGLAKRPNVLWEGRVYRGEVLDNPKHNTLKYNRVPNGNVVLFDISTEGEHYERPEAVQLAAHEMGLEVVPTFFIGRVYDMVELVPLMDRESFLGGTKIEGIVVKNYYRFGVDHHVLMGKLVSEAFKEVHGTDWRLRNPNGRDVVQGIIDQLRTNARWNKAVQHLRDAGTLTDSPKDIGLLFRAVNEDVLKEEFEQIKEVLFKHFWRDIARGVTRGLPEWYKEQLTEGQSFGTITMDRTKELE